MPHLILFSVIIQIMLEKITENLQKNCENAKKSLFDAHFHYSECKKLDIDVPDFGKDITWSGISCVHSKKEFEVQKTAPSCVIPAYGMHPQNAVNETILESADFLENLLQHKEICFIGEAGFDYFTQEFREASEKQEEIWNIQLDLAIKYNVGLVVHCRKANHKLFEYSKQLKKLPEVLFHSFMGTSVEAMSLFRRGLNAYFSFGKQMINGNKKVIECVKNLPVNNLLCETDAPFQFLKGERFTALCDIKKIYEAFFYIRNQNL